MKNKKFSSKIVSAFVLSMMIVMSLFILSACNNTVTVKFYDGTTLYETTKVEKGEKLTYPTNPTKEGYAFKGWSESETEFIPYDNTVAVSKDLSLYAAWSEVFTITYFDGDVIYQTVEALEGDKLAFPTDPTKVGFGFKGWSISATTETLVDKDMLVSGDLSLYAVWSNTKFTVTYVSDGATYKTEEVLYGSKATPPTDMKKEGFAFKGWSTSATENKPYDKDTAVKSAFSLYARWTKIHTVILRSDDVEYKKIAVEDGQLLILPEDPTKEGFVFKGWSTSKTEYIPYGKNEPVKSDLTLYAAWAEAVTVTFQNEDGSVIQVNGKDNQIIAKGTAAIAPEPPTKVGHRFVGWDKDFSNVQADLTVTARFEINSYTLTVEAFGKAALTQNVVYDTAPTFEAPSPLENLNFGGWYFDKEFSNKVIVENFKMPAEDVTIYQKWTLVDGWDFVVVPSAASYFYGDTVTLKANFAIDESVEVMIKWFKDGVLFDDNNVRELVIARTDAGAYLFRAEMYFSSKDTTSQASDTVRVVIQKARLKHMVSGYASIFYGTAMPDFFALNTDINGTKWKLGFEGFVFDETIDDLQKMSDLACAYDVTNPANRQCGDYKVTLGRYESKNYDIIYTDFNLVVANITLTATVEGKMIQYGDAPTTEEYVLSLGMQTDGIERTLPFGDTLAGIKSRIDGIVTLKSKAFDDASGAVGDYAIDNASGLKTENYQFKYKHSDSRLTVVPRELTVEISGRSAYTEQVWTKTGTKEFKNAVMGDGPTRQESVFLWEGVTGLAVNIGGAFKGAFEGFFGTISTRDFRQGRYTNVDDFQWTVPFTILKKEQLVEGQISKTGYVIDVTTSYNVTFVYDASIEGSELILTVENAKTGYNQDKPTFAVNAQGFVNGDTFDSLFSALKFEFVCDYTTGDNADAYDIALTDEVKALVKGLAGEYSAIFVKGTLTVDKIEQPTDAPEAQSFNGEYDPNKTLADYHFENAGFSWVEPTTLPTVGGKTYKAKYNTDPTNYLDQIVEITVTLSKAKAKILSVEHDFTKFIIAYNSYKLNVEISGKQLLLDAKKLKLKLEMDTSQVDFLVGGTYPIKVTVAEDPNFDWVSATVETVLKIKSVFFQSSPTTYYTIEDALKISKALEDDSKPTTLIVKFNTSFAPLAIRNVWYVGNDYLTVKEGVNLVLPFNSFNSTKTDEYEVKKEYVVEDSAYVTLTVPENTTLNVLGTLTVNAKRTGYNTSNMQSAIWGSNYACLNLSAADSIVSVGDGGELRSIGYVLGSGKVVAQSGSTVCDMMTITGWRGGSATSAIYKTVFPFNQFSVNNIETEVVINYGATYLANTKVTTAGGIGAAADVKLIGFEKDAFMQLTGEGYVSKTYEQSSGRVTFDVHGNSSFNVFQLAAAGILVDTEGQEMPLPGNFSAVISSGVTEVSGGVKLLPGASITVKRGATLRVTETGSLFVFKANSGFDNGQGDPIYGEYPHSTSVAIYRHTPAFDFAKEDDAELVIDGKLEVMAYGVLVADARNGGGEMKFDQKAVLTSTIIDVSSRDLDEAGLPVITFRFFTQQMKGMIGNRNQRFETGNTYVGSETGWTKK